MKRKTAEENISKEMIDEQKCGSKQERNRRKGKKKKIGKKTAYEFLVLIRIVQCYFGIFFSYFILSLFLCMASGSFCWESHLSHTSTYSIICAMCIRTKHLTSVYISELETLAERDSFFFLYFFFGSLLRSSTDLSVFRVENLLIRFSIQLTTNVYRCALVFGEHFLNSNRCRIRTKHLMRSNILIV